MNINALIRSEFIIYLSQVFIRIQALYPLSHVTELIAHNIGNLNKYIIA